MGAKKNPPPDDTADDDEVEFTPRQLEVMNNQINAAVSAAMSRKLKPIQDSLSGMDELREQLGTFLKNGAAAPANGGAGQQQQGAAGQQQGAQQQPAGGANQPSPGELALKRQLDAIQEERKQERLNTRNTTRDSKLVELATAAGVDKHRLRGAVALLRDQVKFDKDDNPTMMVTRHGLEEAVGLEDGVGEFFKSDEGKSYLAPQQNQQQTQQRQTQQRGAAPRGTNAAQVARGGAAAPAAGGNAPVRDRDQQKAERKAQALQNLSEQVGALLTGGNIEIS